MSFSNIFNSSQKILSFEFFPPKQEAELEAVLTRIKKLTELKPDFMTVTYGAGGGTKSLTKEMVSYIHNELHQNAVAHLTCVEHTKDEIELILNNLKAEGISNILALRGDPPLGTDKFIPNSNGFKNAAELVEYINSRKDFSIAVSGYPEGHPEAISLEADLQYLKHKVALGAELIITQLFLAEEMFFNFFENALNVGIKVPILPGVLPFSSAAQIERLTSRCQASIPQKLKRILEKYANDKISETKACHDYIVDMCDKLLTAGAVGLHIFTLNQTNRAEELISQLTRFYGNKSNNYII